MSERMNSARRVTLWQDGHTIDGQLNDEVERLMPALALVANRNLPKLVPGAAFHADDDTAVVPLHDFANPEVVRMILLPTGLDRAEFFRAIDDTIAAAHAPFN